MYTYQELDKTWKDLFKDRSYIIRIENHLIALMDDDELQDPETALPIITLPTTKHNPVFGQRVSSYSPNDDYYRDLFRGRPRQTMDMQHYPELAESTKIARIGVSIAQMATIMMKGGSFILIDYSKASNIKYVIDTYIAQVNGRRYSQPGFKAPPDSDIAALSTLSQVMAKVCERTSQNVAESGLEDLFETMFETSTGERVNLSRHSEGFEIKSVFDSGVNNFKGGRNPYAF